MFPPGRLAGIDYGERRIGVAVCDPTRRFASPYRNYERRGPAEDGAFFRALARDESLVGFVVGLPIHADGRESAKSREVRSFVDWLRGITGLPIGLIDERYSSRHADALLRETSMTAAQRKKRRDMLAAQIILSTFLESPRLADAMGEPIDDPPSTP